LAVQRTGREDYDPIPKIFSLDASRLAVFPQRLIYGNEMGVAIGSLVESMPFSPSHPGEGEPLPRNQATA